MARKLGLVAMTLALALSACSSGTPKPGPSQTASASPTPTLPSLHTNATIQIINPKPGQIVHGSTLIVHVKVNGATIITYATLHVDPYHGHVHLRLDGTIVTLLASATYELTGLTKGRHLLEAEFVQGNHVPFKPRVKQEVPFTVE
ncbi:MAG: hypothetical protein ACYDCC_13330 [Actinomycetota bacterium]